MDDEDDVLTARDVLLLWCGHMYSAPIVPIANGVVLVRLTLHHVPSDTESCPLDRNDSTVTTLEADVLVLCTEKRCRQLWQLVIVIFT